MARYLSIAVCQTGPIQRSASRAETVGRLVHLLEQAASAGAEIAVFPEMALTTFFPRWRIDDPDEIDAFFETTMPGPQTQRLYDAAARLKIGFALGYSELLREAGTRAASTPWTWSARMANSSVATARCMCRGRASRKPARRRISSGDISSRAISASRCSTIAACASAWRICNDRRWPETYRMLCLNGAEVVLIGYNTPLLLDEAPALAHLRMFHNHLPMQAGAYQNTLWVAAAAKAGLEDGQALIGGSCIIAPTGEMAAQAMSLDDEIIVHRADLDLIATCRKVNFDFALYRRPDQYRLISGQA